MIIIITNRMSIKDLKMGLFSMSSRGKRLFKTPGVRKLIVVDIKKYEKKIIKSQFKLLNLKVSRSFLIKNKEATINNNVCMLTAKLPIINHSGKV